MDDIQAIKLSVNLMSIAEVAYLSTVNSDGFPETRAMLNLRNAKQFPGFVDLFKECESDLVTYFTTNTSSFKVESIRENPKVCMYYCKADEHRGLMLGGVMEFVTDMDIKRALWQDNWTIFFPGGVTDPDYTILRLRPIVAKGYHQMQTYNLELKGM